MTAQVISTIDAMRASVAEARSSGVQIALVPTMGALHAGHLALVERARQIAGFTVVSIFVNPLQFGPGEDLERYPRTLDADLRLLAPQGVPVVFAPTADELYPFGPDGTRVTAGPVASLFEGATRPGHFDGVLTVVSKLLNIVQPDVVLFGQKDAQQVFLVKRMVADLNVPVEVEVVPIVREDGALALSSRNRYLSAEQRRAASTLSAALAAAASASGAGDSARASSGSGVSAAAALAAAHAVLDAEPGVRLDYVALVDPETFLPVEADHRGPALAILAAYVGATRLIDNRLVTLA